PSRRSRGGRGAAHDRSVATLVLGRLAPMHGVGRLRPPGPVMTGTAEHRPQRMHADEVDVNDALVRRLLAEQFPEYLDLPLRRAPSTGTDNAIYRLGDHLGLRMPRIHWAVPQIAREH